MQQSFASHQICLAFRIFKQMPSPQRLQEQSVDCTVLARFWPNIWEARCWYSASSGVVIFAVHRGEQRPVQRLSWFPKVQCPFFPTAPAPRDKLSVWKHHGNKLLRADRLVRICTTGNFSMSNVSTQVSSIYLHFSPQNSCRRLLLLEDPTERIAKKKKKNYQGIMRLLC